jgi:ABC-type branched-subunit amino acid transport system substrate-binding protein
MSDDVDVESDLALGVEVVDHLPKTQRQKSKAYEKILDKVKASKKGTFKVTFNPNERKPKSVYVALVKKVKDEKYEGISVHLIGNEVYLSKEV